MKRLLRIIPAIALLLCPAAHAQSQVSSMLPANPEMVTEVDSGYGKCSQEQYYFMGVTFEVWNDNADMIRLAEQAAAAYATPASLIKFANGHRFLRAIDIRDYAGFRKFLKSLGDQFDTDVMVQGVPVAERFAATNAQLDAAHEIYISDVVEWGAEPCAAQKKR